MKNVWCFLVLVFCFITEGLASSEIVVSLDASGNLIISGVSGGASNDLITLSNDKMSLRITDPYQAFSVSGTGVSLINPHTVDVELSSFTGDLIIDTKSGNDVLNIDADLVLTGDQRIQTRGITTLNHNAQISFENGGIDYQVTNDFNLNEGSELNGIGSGDVVIKSEGNITIDGTIQNSAANDKGRIVVSGGDQGEVRISGMINASGKNKGASGGKVIVLGEKVGLFGEAKIDASGSLGGGEILLGGEQQGALALKGEANTDILYIDDDAVINADAISEGRGGRIITWANHTNRALGDISARGGLMSGGGFIETSGTHVQIGETIKIDTSSAYGQTGTWLIDPEEIEINSASTIGGASLINASIIEGNLDTTNVTITSNNSIAGNGNITVNESINSTSSNSLTMNAGSGVIVGGSIRVNQSINIGGDINLNAGNGANGADGSDATQTTAATAGQDGGDGGAVLVNAAMNSAVGDIVLRGGTGGIGGSGGNGINSSNDGLTRGKDAGDGGNGGRVEVNAALSALTGSVDMAAGSGNFAYSAGAGMLHTNNPFGPRNAGNGGDGGHGGSVRLASNVNSQHLQVESGHGGAGNQGGSVEGAINSEPLAFAGDGGNGGNGGLLVLDLAEINSASANIVAGDGASGGPSGVPSSSDNSNGGDAGSGGESFGIFLNQSLSLNGTGDFNFSTGTGGAAGINRGGSGNGNDGADGNVGANGDISLSGHNLTTMGNLNFNSAGGLTSSGLITATDINVTVQGQNESIGSTGAGAINTNASGVITASTANGGIYINNQGDLSLGNINAGTGNAELTATDGSLSTGLSALNLTAANIQLSAQDTTAGDNNSPANIMIGSGGINTNGNISFNAADDVVLNGAISSSTGNITVTADDNSLDTFADSDGEISGSQIDLSALSGSIALSGFIAPDAGSSVSLLAGAQAGSNLGFGNGFDLSGAGSINLQGYNLNLGSNFSTQSGGITANSGDGALNITGLLNAGTGDLTLTSTRNLSASQVLSGNNINLNATGTDFAIGSTGAGAIQLNAAGMVTAFASDGTGGTFISQQGDFDMNNLVLDTGTGSAELTAIDGNLSTGPSAFNFSGGLLTLATTEDANNVIADDHNIEIGSGGISAVNTNLTITSADDFIFAGPLNVASLTVNNPLKFQLNGLSSFNQLDVGGTLHLNPSELEVTLGFNPQEGDRFEIINHNGTTGAFNRIKLPSRYIWDIEYNANDITLEVAGIIVDPMSQTLIGESMLSCPIDATLTLQGSEIGFDYYLRNDAGDSVVDGPIAGTGNALDFQTGIISETSSYHVFAANPSFALEFDGIDDDVVIPHSSDFDFSDGLTIEAWVRPGDITVGNQEIFLKENNGPDRLLLSFQDNGTILSFGIETSDDGYTELDVPINAADYNGQWVHIVATFDDPTNAMRLYSNGIEIGNKASNGVMETAANPSAAYIGSWMSGSEFFDGQISSLRIWNTAPSNQQEVDALLDKGQGNLFTGQEPGLVAYYAFYEGAGTVLNDVINDNNGSINEALWTTGTAGGVGSVVSNTLNLVCTVYVDLNATGNDDGSSWVDAFDTVQEGVDASDENGAVLIAQGAYGEGVSVLITKPLSLKGGYPTAGGDQDIDANPTILSGANINRVLRATHITGTLFLEGLIIQDGYEISSDGAGINSTGDLNLNFVSVQNNIATSSIAFHYDTKGAGIYGTANITLINSQVSYNSTSSGTFSFRAMSAGGGIYGTANITLINSQVSHNTVYAGVSNPDVSDFSYVTGGGIHGGVDSTITLINSQVMQNTASSLSENSSISLGGGIFGDTDSVITLTNSQVSHNTASTDSPSFDPLAVSNADGGGIYGSGSAIVHNSVIWGNREYEEKNGAVQTDDFNEYEGETLNTSHSMIRGADLSTSNGIDATVVGFDPLFADEVIDDFRLLAGSPLIDAGSFNLLPLDDYDIDGDGEFMELLPMDLDGYARDVGFNVDIGPYEFGDLIFRAGFE